MSHTFFMSQGVVSVLSILDLNDQGPLLLKWIDFKPRMDK